MSGARLLFAGTPEFAVPSLEALIAAGHPPVAVWTQPDRRAGRGRRVTPPPVKVAAERHGLAVHQPERLNAEEVARMRALAPDLLVVVAYGQILSAPVLALPRRGCVNVHASLLPRWRGAAPIQRALMAGDVATGITLIQMDAGLDTGPMLATASTPIAAAETAGTLHDRLAEIGAALLGRELAAILAGEAVATPQGEAGALYAPKITAADLWLEPTTTAAAVLARQIRALAPLPGARLRLAGREVRVRAAEPCAASGPAAPGRVAGVERRGIEVATAEGWLRITRLQPAGGRELSAADYLNGHPLSVGAVCGGDRAVE